MKTKCRLSHWRETQEKKRKKEKKQGKKQNKKKEKTHVTVLQFVPNHRYAIHVWKIVPRNHAVVICSDIFSHVYGSCRFHMFMVHVERSGTVLPFFVGVSTQSPLPSSCLEYGVLQCSHIFIIRCVFFIVYCISWCLLMCYLFSFMFIYVQLFSFIFISS